MKFIGLENVLFKFVLSSEVCNSSIGKWGFWATASKWKNQNLLIY